MVPFKYIFKICFYGTGTLPEKVIPQSVWMVPVQSSPLGVGPAIKLGTEDPLISCPWADQLLTALSLKAFKV